jgi:D-alanyl-D-alanine carboxypeptidase/D-alanyl-D-alanine-endopeptidase (penicillin-binding protein 4)
MARLSRTFLVIALAGLLSGVAGDPEGDRTLQERLDRVVESRALRGSRTSALVVRGEDGRVLYARDADRPMVPASNQKILTAIATLAAFGPTHRFVTEVLSDVPLSENGEVGSLTIRGGGDPSLTSEDLWRLAADLRRQGLRRVRGDLILDDTLFDAERWHPSWGTISARAYHAPVGALSVNYGAFAAVIEAGSNAGDPVRVSLDPPAAFFRLANRAVTGPARGRGRALMVERSAGSPLELVTVSGSVPAGGDPYTVHRSVTDPALYAGGVLRLQLEANGIEVAGDTRLGTAPESAHPLLAFRGKPVSETVRLFMKFSNNAIAETLVKALAVRAGAGPGSWKRGIPAVRAELDGLGLDTHDIVIADGSGLSYENRIAPRRLVQALRLAKNSFRFGPEFVSALPIASADGTLEKRADGAAEVVRAKTGLLTRVTALSGYARLADGTEAVFSIVSNGYRSDAERAMAALDSFVSELVTAPVALPAPDSDQERLRESRSSS